jgi:preprotein translocase subunit SecG
VIAGPTVVTTVLLAEAEGQGLGVGVGVTPLLGELTKGCPTVQPWLTKFTPESIALFVIVALVIA